MAINLNTKMSEIFEKYPWLPKEMVSADSAFAIINSPVGKMLLQNATVKDLISKTGMDPDDAVEKLNGLIASHK